MKRARGLGRGLDALLAGDDGPSAHGELRIIAVQNLQPGKYQPRTRMDEDSLNTLAESIKAQGLMQPILVREVADQRYEIIAGERRWRAARIAGLEDVPVMVKAVPDEAALAMALIENIQREDLNPLEEAAGIQRLITEFEMTHQAAAAAVGRSRSAVTNLLRLLNLPSLVQDLVMTMQLDMGHARALLALPEHRQLEIAEHVVRRQLSVRETEKLVAQRMAPAPEPQSPPDRDVQDLIERLSDGLGAKVSIQPHKNGAGKLTIAYTDLVQLDTIINKLS